MTTNEAMKLLKDLDKNHWTSGDKQRSTLDASQQKLDQRSINYNIRNNSSLTPISHTSALQMSQRHKL